MADLDVCQTSDPVRDVEYALGALVPTKFIFNYNK